MDDSLHLVHLAEMVFCCAIELVLCLECHSFQWVCLVLESSDQDLPPLRPALRYRLLYCGHMQMHVGTMHCGLKCAVHSSSGLLHQLPSLFQGAATS